MCLRNSKHINSNNRGTNYSPLVLLLSSPLVTTILFDGCLDVSLELNLKITVVLFIIFLWLSEQ